MKGYLVENGELNLMRVDILLREIGLIEESLLRNATRKEVCISYMNLEVGEIGK